MEEFLKYVGGIGGITGILAVLMFYLVRSLIKQIREDRKSMEDRLTGVINQYQETCKQHTDAMVKHTSVLTELITWLKAKNGHS